MIPPHDSESNRAGRVRKLLALEISRIVEDLDARRDFLLEVWGLHRKREPFLETLYSRWQTLGFPHLADLATDEVVILDTFYRELDEFRMYVSYTQDMPTTLGDRYDWIVARLAVLGAKAVDALGGVPERPMVDFGGSAETVAAEILHGPGAAASPPPVDTSGLPSVDFPSEDLADG